MTTFSQFPSVRVHVCLANSFPPGIAIQEGSFLTQLIPMQRDERRKGFALWRGAMGPGGGTPGTDRKLCFTVFPECVAKGCGGCGGWTVFALRALTRHLSSSWARRGSNLSPLGEASGEVCRCQVIVKFVACTVVGTLDAGEDEFRMNSLRRHSVW